MSDPKQALNISLYFFVSDLDGYVICFGQDLVSA